ncbi:MAG: bifunctional diaminohydroxyphosphoribosylaminopyrimidine deaminase/5-amino-6-(5-phosphoribosylamino)uracil reductase RibD [Veillonella sp.]|uniref:bifunctional diaminohydroxyphosphoribosylaminopyrimidine deaminase/5-amino-6-(5-phosphoribosylamino)uracil reductase RibD n=1 Tax=Veillonella sp. TaxID=1926307 RepID=UPI00290FED74|nr:bifunctional diaminohydroxyphosphoribosylaminopyrimidine deaminase/5-amino-6-(5-phosphoribosylamino)uracil reductase RibD [Veillonella sp.]MDU7714945.1 bifunctional diaminohydroxyphosphoribosylaminopyrimidine deaminase/5-amino-6-(5-phosphoribosylamino)uracil reductase RibD [Veillonella sp.]
MMNDELYMKRAISLAKMATGHTSPNPLVGAVVVKNNTIVGEGYHHKAGEAHAEVHALDAAGDNARGATLYVTLEPCAHYGKTPPCAKRVVESGIARVVIGSTDPNPLVAGKGIQILTEAGIEVTTDVCVDECLQLNEHFFTFIQTHKPFVTIKSAMSLDGKIATFTGQSQWITNESSRKDGHILRASHDAMLVGIGTILADDPLLNCRLTRDELYEAIINRHDVSIDNTLEVHQPDIIILDSQGRTPTDAKVFTIPNRKVIIYVAKGCPEQRRIALSNVGAIVEELPTKSVRQGRTTDVAIDIKKIDIQACLEHLGEQEYTSVLVEGGSTIISSFVESLAFDKIITYIGNLVIGGANSTAAVGGTGFATLHEAPTLEFASSRILDNNIRIESYRLGREGSYVYRHR